MRVPNFPNRARKVSEWADTELASLPAEHSEQVLLGQLARAFAHGYRWEDLGFHADEAGRQWISLDSPAKDPTIARCALSSAVHQLAALCPTGEDQEFDAQLSSDVRRVTFP